MVFIAVESVKTNLQKAENLPKVLCLRIDNP